jgi:hypothetical protein
VQFTGEAARKYEDETALFPIERPPLAPVYLGLPVPIDFIIEAIAEHGEGKPVGYLCYCKSSKKRKTPG